MHDYINGLITFVVGLIALAVYQRQKSDHKRDAANIILIELENAERQLKVILNITKPETIPSNMFVMPNSSWDQYKYLFVKDFDQLEWEKITEFYARCIRYDSAVNYDASFFEKDMQEYRINAHRIVADIAKEWVDALPETFDSKSFDEPSKLLVNKYAKKRSDFDEYYAANKFLFSPRKPIVDATEALKDLETNLSLTSVGSKLKRMSQPRLSSRFIRIFS